jgi:hypothetical protein
MSTFTYVTLALADVNFFNYLNDRISLIDHQIKMNQQSLHLSEESTDNESYNQIILSSILLANLFFYYFVI